MKKELYHKSSFSLSNTVLFLDLSLIGCLCKQSRLLVSSANNTGNPHSCSHMCFSICFVFFFTFHEVALILFHTSVPLLCCFTTDIFHEYKHKREIVDTNEQNAGDAVHQKKRSSTNSAPLLWRLSTMTDRENMSVFIAPTGPVLAQILRVIGVTEIVATDRCFSVFSLQWSVSVYVCVCVRVRVTTH